LAEASSYFPHLLEVLPGPGDATKQTLELLWRAAPEQVEEFDAVFAKGIQARLLKQQSPVLGVMYNTLQIPEEVLVQLWLLAHAAWQDFLNFQERKKGNPAEDGKKIVEEAITAAQAVGRGERPTWPSQIPEFRENRDGVEAKAVRQIFAMACAWALMHEVQHAKLYDDNTRPVDPIAEELGCDAYASDILFSKIAKYSELTGEAEERVRGKRAMAAFVGLYFIAKFSGESTKSQTHPPIGDRIKLLFDKIGSAPINHFWDFATALMCELQPKIAEMPVKKPDVSSRDLAYLALEFAFG
jgi:hypothetical protein